MVLFTTVLEVYGEDWASVVGDEDVATDRIEITNIIYYQIVLPFQDFKQRITKIHQFSKSIKNKILGQCSNQKQIHERPPDYKNLTLDYISNHTTWDKLEGIPNYWESQYYGW